MTQPTRRLVPIKEVAQPDLQSLHRGWGRCVSAPLLVHGARATLRWARLKTDRRSQWVRALMERRDFRGLTVVSQAARAMERSDIFIE
jgi:hypothetical protein